MQAKEIARWVALGALFLIPLTPLVVVETYFFPFITGKAFYFRILVEIAVAGWAMLALLDKNYRPRFSWIGAAVVGFVVWMFVADAFAINATKAFWSNFERMEGWVWLAHLLGFFFAASAVLRVEKKWRAWFLTSLGASLIISLYALLQLAGKLAIHQGTTRIDATLGNSAYLAVFLLFSVFVALWLALTEKRAWVRYALIALAALEAVLIFFTETRGTTWGLIGALALAALLYATTSGPRIRRYAISGLVLILVFAGSLLLARDTPFVQNNHALQRISSISLADLQTRSTIWGMAFKGVLERPLTGYGQEGFNYIFNKHYEPSLYGQELWFDRAHNAFIDWLTAGGVPAFLLYLSLFGAAIVLLWRHSELSRPERIALTAAFAGYAVHNFFVFDNLYSYVYFFALLAFIDSQVARPIGKFERLPELKAEKGMTLALPVATVAAVALIWLVNVPSMRVATNLIVAISPSPAGIGANIAAFENLVARPAFSAQEIREQLVSFAVAAVQSPQVTDEEKRRVASLAVTEMQKQVAAYPLDARERLQLSYVYRAVGASGDALKEIQAAMALSPRKEQMWIDRGATEWDAGNVKGAQEAFRTAYSLGPQFPDLAVYAAAGDIIAGDLAAADTVLQNAFGMTNVDSDILAIAYYQTKNWPRLIALSQARAEKPGAPVEAWFSLAAAQYTAGDKKHAVQTVKKAVELFPQAADMAANVLKQIQANE